jgi:hypothetical protein
MKCEGFLHSCDRDDAVRYHMHTAYVDEEQNYASLCPDCQQDSEEYWQDMWDDLNSDIMLGIQDSIRDQQEQAYKQESKYIQSVWW